MDAPPCCLPAGVSFFVARAAEFAPPARGGPCPRCSRTTSCSEEAFSGRPFFEGGLEALAVPRVEPKFPAALAEAVIASPFTMRSAESVGSLAVRVEPDWPGRLHHLGEVLHTPVHRPRHRSVRWIKGAARTRTENSCRRRGAGLSHPGGPRDRQSAMGRRPRGPPGAAKRPGLLPAAGHGPEAGENQDSSRPGGLLGLLGERKLAARLGDVAGRGRGWREQQSRCRVAGRDALPGRGAQGQNAQGLQSDGGAAP